MKYILVTNNQNKCIEIGSILDVEVVSYTTISGHVLDIEETGITYEENALIKVQAIEKQVEGIVFADDSGLEVDALDGRPGLYSARYGGDQLNADQKCEALLDELGGETQNRTARFICVIGYFYGPSGKLGTVRGVLEGRLANELRGDHGFGYDPIFIPKGYDMTLGEMLPDQKRSMSHRYLALMAFKKQITLLDGMF